MCVCVLLHSVPTPVGSQSNADLSGQPLEVTDTSGDPDPQYEWGEVAGHCDWQSPQHTSTLANKVSSHDMQGRVLCVLCLMHQQVRTQPSSLAVYPLGVLCT